jgi:hypothetical protein
VGTVPGKLNSVEEVLSALKSSAERAASTVVYGELEVKIQPSTIAL